MGIIIASATQDLRETDNYTLDLAYGADENDFTLMCSPDIAPPLKGFVYIDNTEYGGTVDAIETDTDTGMCVASGRTWHGMLATCILVPDTGQTHIEVSGTLTSVLTSLIERMSLSERFYAGDSTTKVTYTFDRFTDGYTGLRKMMAANNLKLTITATQKGVCLSGEPARTITDEITSDRVELTITQRGRCVNHLVCAGAGEGTERTILHLYANEAGEISQTQSIFGIDEVTNFYDYSNADDDELLEQGTKKLADLQSEGGIEVSIPDGIDANVGDVIVGFDANTGATVTAEVGKKIVQVESGVMSVSYEVGDASASVSSTSQSSSTSGGGGHAYYAGEGLTLSNWTFNADVTDNDIDAIQNEIKPISVDYIKDLGI